MNFLTIILERIAQTFRAAYEAIYDRFKYGPNSGGFEFSPSGIRDAMNRNQVAIYVLVGLAILGGITYAARDLWSNRPITHAARITQSYYSDDDGHSFFSDESNKLAPFDHDGHPAVRAHVFRCGGSKFVGYLERHTAKTRAAIAAIPDEAAKTDPQLIADALTSAREIKRPGAGEKAWTPTGVKGFSDILTVKCPGGTKGEDLEEVFP